jgi:hypothetical protein
MFASSPMDCGGCGAALVCVSSCCHGAANRSAPDQLLIAECPSVCAGFGALWQHTQVREPPTGRRRVHRQWRAQCRPLLAADKRKRTVSLHRCSVAKRPTHTAVYDSGGGLVVVTIRHRQCCFSCGQSHSSLEAIRSLPCDAGTVHTRNLWVVRGCRPRRHRGRAVSAAGWSCSPSATQYACLVSSMLQPRLIARTCTGQPSVGGQAARQQLWWLCKERWWEEATSSRAAGHLQLQPRVCGAGTEAPPSAEPRGRRPRQQLLAGGAIDHAALLRCSELTGPVVVVAPSSMTPCCKGQQVRGTVECLYHPVVLRL